MRTVLSLVLVAFASFSLNSTAQVKYHASSVNMVVSGTSTLHDWKEKSSAGKADGVFNFNNDKLANVSSLMFTMPANSLKSEHTLMDNNTYKALKTAKNPNITYQLLSAGLTAIDANTFTIKTTGKLTIAGVTKETDVVVTANVNADKSITVSGTKKMKMTDFNVTPPTVMFGSIKTGNDIVLSFNLKFFR